MASDFPTTYDALTNPVGTDLLTAPPHDSQHTNANDILEAIEQRVGLSGTAFPGSPTSGQFFYRTDRDIEYKYNGTRWLSTVLYTLPIMAVDNNLPFAATESGGIRAQVPFAGVYDLWIEKFQMAFFVNGGASALSGSHKWVEAILVVPAGGLTSSYSIDSGASDVWRNSGQITVDALMGTGNFEVAVTSTKTGTPGNLYVLPTLIYRLVG